MKRCVMFRSKSRDIIYISLFLVLVLALWTVLFRLPGPETVQLPTGAPEAAGGYDLTEHDFTDRVYITGMVWESWPDRLYTPQELAENTETPMQSDGLDYKRMQYGTYRLSLRLTPGETYGIAFWSSDYAMRLYRDGDEAVSVGVPGASREAVTPMVRRVTHYFTAGDGPTEFVVQASNFVHREGGWPPVLTVGTAENITRLTSMQTMKSAILFGGLLVAGLYHLIVFLLNRRQVASLLFAALCLLLSLLIQDIVTLALPVYNWFVVFRLEYLGVVLTCAVLLLLIHSLFPDTLHRPALWAYLAACGLYIGVVLLTDTVFFSRSLTIFLALSFLMAAYALVRLLTVPHPWGIKKILTFVGIGAVILFSANNAMYKSGFDWMGQEIGRTFDAPAGMMVLVFCYAAVLAVERAEVDRRLEEAGAALQKAEARYLALSEERQRDASPPGGLSGLRLTRRETEVALLVLDGRSRDEVAALLCISRGTVNTHFTNLYRKAGVSSVAEFVRLLLPGRAVAGNEEKARKQAVSGENHSAE